MNIAANISAKIVAAVLDNPINSIKRCKNKCLNTIKILNIARCVHAVQKSAPTAGINKKIIRSCDYALNQVKDFADN